MMRALVLALLALTACSSQQTRELTNDHNPSGALKEIREAATDSWIYAQLASTVYGDQEALFESPYFTALGTKVTYWSGFKAQAYKLSLPGSEPSIVIAYAGTEGIGDWIFGNFNPFNTQYRQGRNLLLETRAQHPEIKKIVLTGHSLGGAISIYSASREPGVEAYVFNPSIRVSGGKYGTADNIFSVSQYAEVLSALRKALPNPNGTYTTLGCIDKGPIPRHSMRSLAECLTHVAAWDSQLALDSLRTNGLGDRKRIDESTNTLTF